MAGQHIARLRAVSAVLILLACVAMAVHADQSAKKYSKQEINDLLAKVWQTSELDLNNFRDYVFSEREVREYKFLEGNWERLRLHGTPPLALENYRREYVWVIRDGHFVRSLTRLNGVEVSARQQKDSEEQWISEEQKRVKANSALEYFFLSDGSVGSAYALKQMKEGNYKYKAEATLEKRKVIMVEANYSTFFSVAYAFFIAPEENRFVQCDVTMKGHGKYSMIMGQPIDKTWLPLVSAGSVEFNFPAVNTPNGLLPACHFISRHSREFYSFKKSEVKAKFWFEDNDAGAGHDADKPQSKL